MRSSAPLALVAFAAAACEVPSPRLICHNGNCAEPTDPARDDTIEALLESLDLEHAGRPAIDGIEIDTFWRGSDDTCLYAHDLDAPQMTVATAPADELARWFARSGPLTFGAGPFHVSIELKAHVSTDKASRHDAAQRVAHARCAWDLYRILDAAAVAHQRDVEITFSSFSPDLLRAVIAERPPTTATPVGFGSIYGIPPPLDSQTVPLEDYTGIPLTVIEIHAQWITDAQAEAVRIEGVDLVLWMFSVTVETLAAIETHRPDMIVTSEARLMRRWLERSE